MFGVGMDQAGASAPAGSTVVTTVNPGGTVNYLAKWTSDGTQLGDSRMKDDGTVVTLQTTGNSGINFYASGITNRFQMFVGNGSGGFTADEFYFQAVNSGFHFRWNAGTDKESFAIVGNRVTMSTKGVPSALFNTDHFVTETDGASESAIMAIQSYTGGTAGTRYAGVFKIEGAGTGTSMNVAGYFKAANAAKNYAIMGDGRLNFLNVPTSASGLSTGDVWSNSGVLTLV